MIFNIFFNECKYLYGLVYENIRYILFNIGSIDDINEVFFEIFRCYFIDLVWLLVKELIFVLILDYYLFVFEFVWFGFLDIQGILVIYIKGVGEYR